MKIVEKIKLNPNATIKDALQIIDSGSMKIALVLDEKNKRFERSSLIVNDELY